MNHRAVALLSGGLDSTLAICILRDQGIEIEAVNFQTIFGCCKDDSRRVAHRLGVGFTHLTVNDDYLKLVENPKYGYGRGANPCVDCRIYMFRAAKRYMEKIGASFLISGEVLYQRPMSQKMKDFLAIERDAGLQGLILRPLSALLLPKTRPEEEGIVDRSRLFAIQGRSRARLLELAAHYGIENPPSPSAGCSLTSPAFGRKVRDVFEHHPDYERWHFELLKVGRHFRVDSKAKVIVARNHTENEYLQLRHPPGTLLMKCKNFSGPSALLIGSTDPAYAVRTAKIILRYAQKPLPESCQLEMECEGEQQIHETSEAIREEELERLRIQ